jgi:cell division protein FtsQ
MSAYLDKIWHNTSHAPKVINKSYRSLYPLIIILTITALSYSFLVYLNDAVRFPVTRVEIGGRAVYLNKEQLMQIVKKHTKEGFFGLNIENVREEVRSLPWLKSASVRRVFPDRLHIDVIERQAKMQWNENGLIDKENEVFYPPQLAENSFEADVHDWRDRFAHMPHLKGSDSRTQELQKSYNQYNTMLGDIGVKLLGLHEDGRRSQTLLLNSDVIVKLGYEKLELRFERFRHLFLKYVPSATKQGVQFDMRYTNGFTVASAGNNSNSITGYN